MRKSTTRKGTNGSARVRPATTPEDAEWGERYFHLTDPDDHEISFAKPLRN